MENKQQKELAAQRAAYPVFDGGVKDEVLQAWRQAHGRVVAVDIYDDMAGEHHIGYFHRPSMDTMSS